MMKEDMIMSSNFTQEVTLPSRGIFNPELPGGKLVQRCMMVSDQKFLYGSTQSNSMEKLIQRTIESPEGFDISKLTAPDTLYLLFKLRVLSYGSNYTFITRCPECGKKIEVKADLSQVPVEYLDEDFSKNLEVTLPNTGDTVYTKILTNADTEDLDKEIKRRKKRNPDDESEYILRIARSIEKIKIAGSKTELTNNIDIERYISELTSLDAAAITSSRNKIIYGVIPTVDLVCPECHEDISVDIIFSGKFFRPEFSE